MKLAYVTALFPFAPAEQFFEPEIESLGEFFEVVVMPARARRSHNYYPALRATAQYLGALDGTVIRLALREFLRDPRAAAAAFGSIALPAQSLRARIVNCLLFPKALAFAHEIRRLGIEHVHVNWMTSSATIVYVASRLTRIPFSITAHQHDIFFDNLTVPKVRAAQFVRVISARNCRHLQELLPPELRGKCFVIHLGVRLPATPAVPQTRATPHLLCAARMCQWKGHRYLIAALALLRDQGVPFTCDFAGDGETRGAVERDIARTGLGDRIRMLGNVPHAKLIARLESGDYDIGVLASTEQGGEHEGIPVSLMEAMAVCLPVVATRTGSIEELVDAESGLLVEQRDPVALAAALQALIADPARRKRLGDRGRRRVAAQFATEATSRLLAELLLRAAPWAGRQAEIARGGQKSYP